jgi:hypothetical protein
MLSVAYRCCIATPHARNTVRPEQPPLRVHKPPLALVFLCAEMPGCL